MEYKRYMCFEICEFYPSGGVSDCKESYDDLEDALTWLKNNNSDDSAYIFDRIEGKLI
jgi:hypothetical protein